MAVAVGLVAGSGVTAVAFWASPSKHTASPIIKTSIAAPLTGSAAAGPLNVRAIVAQVEPAVVAITSGSGRGRGAGTGMLLTSGGQVLTNAHVVEGGGTIRVAIPGHGTHTAHVTGADSSADVALAQVDGVSGLPTVQLGSSAGAQVGDPVLALGNALGLGGAPSVTEGIVSALDRSLPGGSGPDHLLQTDAAINPGNSGGPLVDSAGHVIGMTTAIAGNAQNIGFVIPTDQIRPLLDHLPAPGSPGASAASTAFLGVASTDTDDGSPGALIQQVEPGSPADSAGVRAGDVITSVDSTSVGSANDLVKAIHAHKPGDRVRLTWSRGGQSQSATVTLVSTGA